MNVSVPLTDSRLVFALSILFGLLLPRVASLLEPLIVPSLIAMMTLSLAQVSSRHVHKHHERRTIIGLVLINYLVCSVAYVTLTFLFVPVEYRPALFLLALVPPAIGVLPLTRIMHGDLEVGFFAELSSYAIALIIIPVGTLVLFGESASPLQVLKVLALVILLPFVLSRIIRRTGLAHVLSRERLAKSVINVCYAISFSAVIGLNRDVLFEPTLVLVALVLVGVKFGASWITWLATVHRMPRRVSVLYMLFSSLKNGGAAIAIAVILFGPASTTALAVNAMIVPFHILFMERLALH